MTAETEELIHQAYMAFNARNIDAVLDLLHPDVLWANGWEGGYVKGHKELKEYWKRQWRDVNPMAYPVAIKEDVDGTIEVHIRQIAKDVQGKILFDGVVKHIYTLENDKITSMEIDTV